MKPNPNHRVLYWILALAVVMFGIVVYNLSNKSEQAIPQLFPEQIAQAKKIQIIKALSESSSSGMIDRKMIVVKTGKSSQISPKMKADIISSLGNK